LVVGYIFASRKFAKEDRIFIKLAKEKNIELVMFNLSKKIDENEFENNVKKCDVVYNNTAEDFIIESLKTIEELGKKVIDTSQLYYYTEDKWMFYIKCREHGILTPETILLSNNLNVVRAELKEFGHWPVVLKRIYGTMGEFVKKADNSNGALRVIKKFWNFDSYKLPIIAQEFIQSPCYRVTVIDKKIVQAVKKTSRNWKSIGVYSKKSNNKFKVDKKLKGIINKVVKVTKINICGIDLLKKDNQWFVLEVNTDPGLDFIDDEHEKLVGRILDFLKKDHRKNKSKKK
jgi:glutathione synthase/RimK-type ligase-like ATP-grasp enzyme